MCYCPDTLGCKSYIYHKTTETKCENEHTNNSWKKKQIKFAELKLMLQGLGCFFLDLPLLSLFSSLKVVVENYFSSLKTKNKHVHNH